MFNYVTSIKGLMGLILVSALMGCLSTEKAAPVSGTVLPKVAIASTILSPGESVVFYGKQYTLDQINMETYPSTVVISQGAQTVAIEVDGWQINNNVLIQAMLPNKGSETAQIKFHELGELWKNWAEPANPEIPFPTTEFREGSIEFFKNGVISLQDVRDNDPVDNLDDTADARLFWKGKEYTKTVREYSHTQVLPDLYVKAEEIFTGERDRDGSTSLSLLTSKAAFATAKNVYDLTINRQDEVKIGNFTVKADFLPVASKTDAIGVEITPETYRCILSFTERESEKTQEFILNPEQSQRWGNIELLLRSVSAQNADFTVYEYTKYQYPTARRSANEQLVGETTREAAVPPKWIERELSPPDFIEYQGATISVLSIRGNDPSNLFDDQVEVGVVSRNLAQTVLLKEGTKQIVRGNNRWWIIEAKDVVASGPRGTAILRIESEQIVGPRK